MTDPEVTMDDALVNNNLIAYLEAAEADADPGPVPATGGCHSR